MSAKSQAETPNHGHAVNDEFQALMVETLAGLPAVGNPVQELLEEHFGEGVDVLELPAISRRHYRFLDVCYQLGLTEFLSEREHRIVGVQLPSVTFAAYMGEVGMSKVMSRPTFAFVAPVFGPLDYFAVASGSEDTYPCLRQGLVFFKDAEGPGVIWIRNHEWEQRVVFEVVASTVERCNAVLDDLHERAMRLSPYRGQVIELSSMAGMPHVTFLERPRQIERDQVILPSGLLDQIEQHSLGVIQAQSALKASGRHLKRGLLLHGRPGTGKTHTIKYLLSKMPGATVVVLSGARLLQPGVLRDMIDLVVPGVIILDDVDFVAEDRWLPGGALPPPGDSGRESLFELLDVLDGVTEDADLLFLMTTNRPNEIEPAIAARPGRVDQAIEVPLPDADCRRGLFELYSQGLDVRMSESEIQAIVDQTDGGTASLIRELLRRASVSALREGTAGDDESTIVVTATQVQHAVDQLLDPANPVTPLLLGAVPKHAVATVSAATIAGR